MENLFIEKAKPEQLPVVQKLLRQAKLPFEDIEKYFEHFFIAKNNENIIAAAGIEVYPPFALLRSFVVAENYRSKGIGQMLYEAISDYSKEKNIQTLYLLTETAENFFSRNQFTKIKRDVVPENIAATEEFKTLCASTAITMMKNI